MTLNSKRNPGITTFPSTKKCVLKGTCATTGSSTQRHLWPVAAELHSAQTQSHTAQIFSHIYTLVSSFNITTLFFQ